MQKNRFQYYIKGYRYAPESFHAFKGLSGHRPVEIPLSDSQRQQMGYLCVTQSGKAAIDYVKRIERARARKPKSFVTYGFQVREDPRREATPLFCSSERSWSACAIEAEKPPPSSSLLSIWT